jgi:hypothetical protein
MQNSGCHSNRKKKLKRFSLKKPKELVFCLFGMKHHLVRVYQVCSNNSPGVKIGPALGVIDFPYLYTVKTLKNLLLKNSNSFNLDFWHETFSGGCLPNRSPRVKIGPAPRGHCFPYMYIVKT